MTHVLCVIKVVVCCAIYFVFLFHDLFANEEVECKIHIHHVAMINCIKYIFEIILLNTEIYLWYST